MSTAAPPLVRRHRSLAWIWKVAHNNSLTLVWLTALSVIGWTVTVISCH